MIFLQYFIPLLSSFIIRSLELFIIPVVCLSFLCTVPYIIRSLVKWS